jgi:hypothetical protein
MELLAFGDGKEEANLAKLEEGKMMEGKWELKPPSKEELGERAFSPALDVQLGPSEAEKAIEATSRKVGPNLREEETCLEFFANRSVRR